MQIVFTIITLAALGLIIWYLIEIRAALIKRGKVACWYCGSYFPIAEVETHGTYTYCAQHGVNRRRKTA